MQLVHFCSGTVFTTGDAITRALLRYTRAIAAMHRDALVVVPALSRTGGHGEVTLLLNDVVQISSELVESSGAELRDDDFVRRLEGLTRDLVRVPELWDWTRADEPA